MKKLLHSFPTFLFLLLCPRFVHTMEIPKLTEIEVPRLRIGYEPNQLVAIANNGLPIGNLKYLLSKDGTICAIPYLRINRDYRNKGYGTRLLKKIKNMAIAANCKEVALFVAKNNTGAQDLYLRNGFKCTGITHNILYRMTCTLPTVRDDSDTDINSSSDESYYSTTDSNSSN